MLSSYLTLCYLNALCPTEGERDLTNALCPTKGKRDLKDTELGLTPDEDGVELSGKARPPPVLVGLGRIHKAGVVGFLVEGRPISKHWLDRA